MTTARNVYNAFKSHKERQETVLASIKTEKSQLVREFEASSETLITTFIKLYPSVSDLPLDVMQEASKAPKGGVEHDFRHMVEALRAEDERLKAAKTSLVKENGSMEEINEKIDALDKQSAGLKQVISSSEMSVKQIKDDLQTNIHRREEIQAHFEKSGVEITDKTSDQYLKFRLGKFLFNSEWRKGNKAVVTYIKRGGESIDADVRDFKAQQAQLEEMETLGRTSSAQYSANLAEKKRLQSLTSKIVKLDADIQGEEKIHKAVCSSFVDILRDDEAAQFIGQKLPNDKADPLMVEVLKYRNLRAIYDNLETLRLQAEKALGKVSEPISKLKKLVSHAPSKSIKIDLDEVSTQFGKFNNAAEGFLGKSQKMRRTLGNFSPSLNRSSSPVVTPTHDDSFLFISLLLMTVIMSENNVSHNMSPDISAPSPNLGDPSSGLPNYSVPDTGVTLPDTGITVPDTGIPVPDFGSTINVPSLDTGSISIPSIDVPSFDMGSISIPTIDVPSFDMGSINIPTIDIPSIDMSSMNMTSIDMSSSFTSFDTTSISTFISTEDTPRRGIWMPDRANTHIYASI